MRKTGCVLAFLVTAAAGTFAAVFAAGDAESASPDFGTVFFSAPDGKRLIVQHVSARVRVPDGATAEVGLEKWFPGLTAGAFPDDIALTLTLQRQSGSEDVYHANEPASLIVGDADGPAIEGEPGAGPNGFFVVLQVSGGDDPSE